jgi:hypothetical protein
MSHQIDVTRGELRSEVSSQWANRPDDQKFLSLNALHAQVRAWADESRAHTTTPGEIIARDENGGLMIDVSGANVNPTAYSFDQIAALADAPPNYLRRLPAALAAENLNHGLRRADAKPVSAYLRENGSTTLRGITSTRYGRIFDAEVISAIQQIAGNGTGDTNWKIPGTIDWGKMTYNPNVDITKDTTTLYASDRDVFVFLVDDRNPIEIGKLPNGEPDYVFRGFYCWNSEVGSRTAGLATMLLRGVCQNRNLWGVENFRELAIRHTQFAPDRFMAEWAPTLASYADASTHAIRNGIAAARGRLVAKSDEERIEFLARFGFGKRQAQALIGTSLQEEGRPPESIWDFAQAVTATARGIAHQDRRIALEGIATRMLDKAL